MEFFGFTDQKEVEKMMLETPVETPDQSDNSDSD